MLRLVADEATNGKNYDHASWGDAKLVCADEEPEAPVVVDTAAQTLALDGYDAAPALLKVTR